MSYELIQEFSYTNSQKQIFKLVKGTRIEEDEADGNFIIKSKGKIFKLERDVVVKNPDYFKKVDWVLEMGEIIKTNKKATSPRLAKMIADYISSNVMKNQQLVSDDLLKIMLEACRIQYYSIKDQSYLEPITKLGWSYNENGVYPPIK